MASVVRFTCPMLCTTMLSVERYFGVYCTLSLSDNRAAKSLRRACQVRRHRQLSVIVAHFRVRMLVAHLTGESICRACCRVTWLL